MGALDLALWDLKGKALGVPVYELLGGLARDHMECYSTGFPNQGDLEETARACTPSTENWLNRYPPTGTGATT